MGKAVKFFFEFNYNLNFNFSDFVDIIGIIVNSILAIWIVRTIQNKLTNRRVLKDHFISEVKDLRAEYNQYIQEIYAGRIFPQDALRWFKLMDIKKTHLMTDVSSIYKVFSPNWNTFHIDLRELITNSPEYSANFRNNRVVIFSQTTKRKLDRIQTTHNGLFNKLIIAINDAN